MKQAEHDHRSSADFLLVLTGMVLGAGVALGSAWFFAVLVLSLLIAS